MPTIKVIDWKVKRKEIQKLSEKELHQAVIQAGLRQRRTAAESIAFLAESARRKDYAKRSYQSLGSYALEVMKVPSSSSAYRYAQAAWLSLEFPETLEAIEKGELTLEAASMAWQAFREKQSQKKTQAQKLQEKIRHSPEFNLSSSPFGSKSPLGSNLPIESNCPKEGEKPKLSQDTKREIIETLKNKTHAQVQKTIAVAMAQATGEHLETHRPRGRTKPQGAKWNELLFYLSDEELELFQRLRGLLSHKVGDTDLNSTFLRLLTEALEKHDPVEIEKRKELKKKRAHANKEKKRVRGKLTKEGQRGERATKTVSRPWILELIATSDFSSHVPQEGSYRQDTFWACC